MPLSASTPVPPSPSRSSASALTLSQVLMTVHAELRQRLDASVASEDSNTAHSALNALTEEDWNVVLYPVSELRPYLLVSSSTETTASVATNGSAAAVASRATTGEHYNVDVLTKYVKCRCAELPMRLQTEAVLLRRHEYVVRQRMRELIELSEYVAVCGGQAPELRLERGAESAAVGSGGGGGGGGSGRAPHPAVPPSAMTSPSVDDVLPNDVQTLLSPSEAARRLQRAQERIGELEKLVHQESWQRLRCSQRMVLMSEVTRALMRQLQRATAASGDATDSHDPNTRPSKKQRTE